MNVKEICEFLFFFLLDIELFFNKMEDSFIKYVYFFVFVFDFVFIVIWVVFEGFDFEFVMVRCFKIGVDIDIIVCIVGFIVEFLWGLFWFIVI